MKKKLKQYTEVDIHTATIFDNDKLYQMIVEKSVNPDKGAMMTTWYERPFQDIAEYVRGYINKHGIYNGNHLKHFHIWGQLYNEGDHQTSHDHVPYVFSWIYYVKSPKGSSPIVFESSDYKLYPKESDLIIFPSWVEHYVPNNKCKGRAIVAGNLGHKEKPESPSSDSVLYNEYMKKLI